MSGRAYLSIGDVLSLLRQEFPDITISKIRFLESQGLVDPERSPSGYRKFYEGDVERLRWVLRQQREHFLPLKVIRDRLAAAGNGVPPDDLADEVSEEAAVVSGGATAPPAAAVAAVPVPVDEAGGESAALAGTEDLAASGLGWIAAERERLAALAAAPAGAHGHAPAGVVERHGGWDDVDDAAMVRVGAPAGAHEAAVARVGAGANGAPGRSGGSSPRHAESAGADPVGGPGDVTGAPAATPVHAVVGSSAAEDLGGARVAAPAAPAPPVPTPPLQTAASVVGEATPAPPGTPEAASAMWAAPDAPAPVPSGAAAERPARERGAATAAAPEAGSGRPAAPRAARHAAPVAAPTPAPASAPGVGGAGDVLAASVSGVSLTLEELCTACGLSVAQIGTLESFGLLAPMPVAGVSYYDEEALTVAKLVAEFGRYGIEPRHLRLYRNAVDREVGLIEQVITPLLRQRNPEARQRAVASAADLVRLGQGLRASLVRVELRRQLGG